MSNPFSGIPDPGTPRPPRRRFEPGLVQEALRALKDTLRPGLQTSKRALQEAQRVSRDAFRRAQRQGQDLWLRGKRNPRKFGMVGGAVALTLVGAYTVGAFMSEHSLCPTARAGKTPKFVVLMDSVPQLAAGSAVEIQYDICGLAAGTPYRGKVRLVPHVKQQRTASKKKKKSTQPKPLVVSFKDQTDGAATRRQQQVSLASTKPGTYTLELIVTDNKGRDRKRVQKVVVRGR